MKEFVEFDSAGQRIRGHFYLVDGKMPQPTVLLLAGFPPVAGDSWMGQHLAQNGINCLSFGYRGTLQSEGYASWQHAMEDIGAAVGFLHQDENIRRYKIDTSRFILGGVSFGGGMALAYAAHHPSIKRIVTVAPDDYGEFAREYGRSPTYAQTINAVFAGLEAPAGPIRFDSKGIMEELLENPGPYDLRLNAPMLADRDLLLIGGWDDVNVSLEHRILPVYRALKAAAAKSVRIVAFQDDHSFARSKDEMGALIVNWIKK